MPIGNVVAVLGMGGLSVQLHELLHAVVESGRLRGVPFREQFRKANIGNAIPQILAQGQRDHVGWEAVRSKGMPCAQSLAAYTPCSRRSVAPLKCVPPWRITLPGTGATTADPPFSSASSIPGPASPQRNPPYDDVRLEKVRHAT